MSHAPTDWIGLLVLVVVTIALVASLFIMRALPPYPTDPKPGVDYNRSEIIRGPAK